MNSNTTNTLNKVKKILKDSEEIPDVMEELHKLNEVEKIPFHEIMDELVLENSPFVIEYTLACTWMGHFEQDEYYIPEMF